MIQANVNIEPLCIARPYTVSISSWLNPQHSSGGQAAEDRDRVPGRVQHHHGGRHAADPAPRHRT